jgi:hypothetical protein
VNRGCKRLFVLWREPDAGRRHVVGELWQDDEGYAFGYGHDVDRALERGFTLLLEFPERHGIDAPYRSEYLFSTFAQRIPSPKRPDYQSILESWQVTAPDSPLDILAMSGGIQLTDRLEVAEYRAPDDPLQVSLTLRVAGEEHYPGSQKVGVGDELKLVREPGNAHDSSATMLVNPEGALLGYVPRQYSAIISRCLDTGVPLQAIAIRRLITPDDRDRWVVRVSRTAA